MMKELIQHKIEVIKSQIHVTMVQNMKFMLKDDRHDCSNSIILMRSDDDTIRYFNRDHENDSPFKLWDLCNAFDLKTRRRAKNLKKLEQQSYIYDLALMAHKYYYKSQYVHDWNRRLYNEFRRYVKPFTGSYVFSGVDRHHLIKFFESIPKMGPSQTHKEARNKTDVVHNILVMLFECAIAMPRKDRKDYWKNTWEHSKQSIRDLVSKI